MPGIEGWYRKADNESTKARPAHLHWYIPGEGVYEAATLPVIVGDEQWLLSAFCDDTGPVFNETLGIPRTIYSPRVLQWIHYPSGDFRWEEPSPDAYGLATAIRDDFGMRLGPIQRGHLPKNAWREARMRYPALMLRVVEERWLVTAYPTTAEERETARALQAYTHALYDAPLLPFYHHYGRNFLSWMERAAR